MADAVFQGTQRMDYITRTMMVSSASIFVFAVAALLLGLGLEGFVTGITLGCLVRMLVGTSYLRRHFGRLSPREVQSNEVRRLTRAAGPLMGATILGLVFHRIDILMLSRMVDEAHWGYYGVAVRVVDVGTWAGLRRRVDDLQHPAHGGDVFGLGVARLDSRAGGRRGHGR